MPTFKRVLGPRWLQLPLANLPILGTQFVWSAEMAFVSPYLLELGLTRAHMALVMLAAPISGLVVQPVIGEPPVLPRREINYITLFRCAG